MHTFLIAAISVDGFLADKTDQKSTNWTSKEDFQFFSKRTKEAKVLVMGSTTYQTIGHPLKDRHIIVVTSRPESIEGSQDIQQLPSYQEDTSITATVCTTSLSPQELVQFISEKNYKELAICGGSSIYTQYVQSGLVETFYITIEPIFFGTGVPLFNQGFLQNLTLTNTSLLNQSTILLEYHPNHQT